MSIHSIGQGLPGNKISRLAYPGTGETSVIAVDSPPAARRRIIQTADEIGALAGMTATVRVSVPAEAAGATVDLQVRVSTPDGKFVIGQIAEIGAGGSQSIVSDLFFLRDDEELELAAISSEGAAAGVPIDVLASFSDVRASVVGRERVQIPPLPAGDAVGPRVTVVPEPSNGKMHVPFNNTGNLGSYIVIGPGTTNPGGGAARFFLDNDGTIIESGPDADSLLFGSLNSDLGALEVSVREELNQRLLAAAISSEGGSSENLYAFTSYLIVPDPKIGQPGNSA